MKLNEKLVDSENFKNNIHYYLSQLTAENTKVINIQERYGDFIVMSRKQLGVLLFDAFMCGLDETLVNYGFSRLKDEFLKSKKEEENGTK